MSSSDDEIVIKPAFRSTTNAKQPTQTLVLKYGGHAHDDDLNDFNDNNESNESFVDTNTSQSSSASSSSGDDGDDVSNSESEIEQANKRQRISGNKKVEKKEKPVKEPKQPKEKVIKEPKVQKEKATPKKKPIVVSTWDAFDDADFDLTPTPKKQTPTPSTPAKVSTTTTTTPTPNSSIVIGDDSDGDIKIKSSQQRMKDEDDIDHIASRRAALLRPNHNSTAPTTTSAAPSPAPKKPVVNKKTINLLDMDDESLFEFSVPTKPPVSAPGAKPTATKPLTKPTTLPTLEEDDEVQLPPPKPTAPVSKPVPSKPSSSSQQPSSQQPSSQQPSSQQPSSQPSPQSFNSVSAYLDDDEDEVEVLETAKDGGPVNIFAKMMGTKRKAPETIIKEKIVKQAPNRGTTSNTAMMDGFDDDFADFNPKSTSSSSSTTPTTSFMKFNQNTTTTTTTKSTRPTPATTTTTTSNPSTPSQTRYMVAGTGDDRSPDESCWDAWGEEHFRPQDVSWLPGEQIPYSAIASMFSKCEDTRKRLLIISYLRDFLRAVIYNSPDQLLAIVYMVSNQVAPAFEGIELGIGNAILEKVIIETTGTTTAGLKEKMVEIGDLGLVAQSLKSRIKSMVQTKKLYCGPVFNIYRQISKISGRSSQDQKRALIKGLFVNSQGNEARFLIRAFQGNLRINLALQTVLRSLAEALVMTPPLYKDGQDGTITEADMAATTNNDDDSGSDGEDGDKKKGGKKKVVMGDDDNDDDLVEEKDGRKAGSKKKTARDQQKKSQSTLSGFVKTKDGSDFIIDNDDDDDFRPTTTTTKKAAKAPANQPLFQRQCQWAMKILESAYNEGPSFDRLIPVLLEYPLPALRDHCMLCPGLPIKVMLGKPGTSVGFAVDKLIPDSQPRPKGKALLAWEYKYDGERAQIHLLPDGSVQIFSRHMEPYTAKYPDVIARLPRVMKRETKTFIIDCEIVAWDVQKKKILPFQVLSTRKRKDVDADNVSIQVQLFPFDMLYYNGQSLMKTEFIKRRELLHGAFNEIEGILKFATYVDGEDEETISNFLPQAISDSCEGLMAKPLYGTDSYYVPDKRKWIKLKKDYLEGVGDTLDLVILGAWHGNGKRAGVYGTFLYFCFDPDTEQYQSMTCIGTGYSDAALKELHEKLQEHTIDEPQANYSFIPDTTNPPDVWFAPKLVAEVKCADLTVSSDYMASFGSVVTKDGSDGGVGMRFPRFLRLREDKPPTASTSPEQITEMYYNQSSV